MDGETGAGRTRGSPSESGARADWRAVLAAGASLALVVGALMAFGGGSDGGGPTDVVAGDFASATDDTTGSTHGDDHASATTHDAAHTDGAATHGTHDTNGTHAEHDTPDDTTGGHDHTTTASTLGGTHDHDTTTGTTTPGHDDHTTATTGGSTDTTHDHTTVTSGTTGTTHPHTTTPPGELSAQTLAEIDVARQVALQYPTAADAEAAGWHKITIFLPGIAAHYLHSGWLDSSFVLSQPEVLLYGGEGLDAPIVGVNYIVSGSTPPAGFTGDADHWHEHPTLCYNASLGLIVGDETETSASCAAKGGVLISFADNWLLHVWCVPGWEAPEGIFSHENSKVV